MNKLIRLIVILTLLLLTVSLSLAGSYTLTWTAPTTNVDGTPISGLAGYNIYFGMVMGGLYPNVVTVSDPLANSKVVNLGSAAGNYYMVATAFNQWGNESEFSNEVLVTIALPSCK